MPRLFVSREEIAGNTIVLTGENAHHLNVLRVKVRDEITLCDFCNTEYRCAVTQIDGAAVTLSILSASPAQSEFPFPVTLYMALPKGDKMEWIVQKSVELGVGRIVPFSSLRTVVKLDAANAQKKRERWQKIAHSAAEQCGRGIVPTIETPVSFARALEDCAFRGGTTLFCYENEEETSLARAFSEGRVDSGVSFFIGAEGGFDEKEAQAAIRHGLRCVTLGKRILRCETAPLYVLASLDFFCSGNGLL